MRKWWLSLRPFSFTASLIPMLFSSVISANDRPFDWFGGVLACLTGLILHIIANLFNSYYDWILGHDQPGDSQVVPILLDKKYGTRALYWYGISFLLLGTILTIVLGLLYGRLVFWITLVGLATAYFYTVPPIAIKNRGWSLPTVFLTMGLLMPVNVYLIQTGNISYRLLFCSLPLALLVTAILQGNELRDYYSDWQHGIVTLTVRYGQKFGVKLYKLLILAPYFLTIISIILGYLPVHTIVTLLTLGMALNLIRKADQRCFSGIDTATAKLHALFGLCYILAVITN